MASAPNPTVPPDPLSHLRQRMIDERLRHRTSTREHGDDPPEIPNWTWPQPDAAR